LPIKVYHRLNSEFRLFIAKNGGNIKNFHSYFKVDAYDTETHFLTHYRLFSVYAAGISVYDESVDMVTSGHVTKMAVTPIDPLLLKTP